LRVLLSGVVVLKTSRHVFTEKVVEQKQATLMDHPNYPAQNVPPKESDGMGSW
jgi:hypothetical protein